MRCGSGRQCVERWKHFSSSVSTVAFSRKRVILLLKKKMLSRVKRERLAISKIQKVRQLWEITNEGIGRCKSSPLKKHEGIYALYRPLNCIDNSSSTTPTPHTLTILALFIIKIRSHLFNCLDEELHMQWIVKVSSLISGYSVVIRCIAAESNNYTFRIILLLSFLS